MSFSLVPGFAQRYPKSDDPDFEGALPRPRPADPAAVSPGSNQAPPLIETCCTTLDQALAAQSRGAGRIELCTDLSVGGLTPSRDLIREVAATLTIPVNVLVRPSAQCATGVSGYPSENSAAHGSGGGAHALAWEGGFQRDTLHASTQATLGFTREDFVCDEAGLEQMLDDIAYCKTVGVSGIVIGVLTPQGTIDLPAMRRLMAAAAPLPVTFHRAFDVCTEDPFIALDKIIALGCARLLSSGQAPTAWEGRALLTLLVRRAGSRLIVMPGCGVLPENIKAIAGATCAREIHGTRIP
jgi:copper homeostasis protein